MELNHTNPNGEIIVASNLHPMDVFFFKKLQKIQLKNKSYPLFFQENALISSKTRLFITFT